MPGRLSSARNSAVTADVFLSLRGKMSKCITCGTELHPERAAKYNYCMAPECQQKNAKGLTIAVVGMNKAAEEFVILDEATKADLASGRYHDQRRGSFGTSTAEPAARTAAASAARATAAPAVQAGQGTVPARHPAPKTRPPRPRPASTAGPQAVEQKAGEARAPLQRARPPASRDSRQARRELVSGDPDHPGREKPRQALTATASQLLGKPVSAGNRVSKCA